MPLGADALTFGCPRPLPKESVLSRRHRAPATASPGSARLAAARDALERSRARIVLVLAATCAGLLVAAPIALLVSGRVDGGGTSHDADGVFVGEPGAGADSGPRSTGAGPGDAGSGIATQSAAAPSPGVPSWDGVSSAGSGPAGSAGAGTAVGGGTTGGVVAGGASGVPGGGNRAPGGGTAAGAPAPAGGGTSPQGGTTPGGGSSSGSNPGA